MYQNCLGGNLAKINLGYHHANVEFARCVRREVNTKGQSWITKEAKRRVDPSDRACLSEIRSRAATDAAESNKWFLEQVDRLDAAQEQAVSDLINSQSMAGN